MNWKDHSGLIQIQRALTDFLAQHVDIQSWLLEAKYSEGCQSLLLGETNNTLTVYQDRNIDDLSFNLALFAPSTDGKTVGSSKGTLDLNQNLADQMSVIRNNALLAVNPAFKLAQKPEQPYPAVTSADKHLLDNLNQTHQDLTNRLCNHAKTLPNVHVNSAELFSNLHYSLLLTSEGIEAEKVTTDLYFEVAMERQPLPNTQEVLKYWHFVGLSDADIEEKLDAVARETQMTDQSSLPQTSDNAVVLIDSYAISKLVKALVDQMQGSAEYSKGPHLKTDDEIATGELDPASDKLNITIDPTLPHMAKTSPFTEEGLIAEKSDVIIDNKVTCQLMDSRMAQYLNKAVNGIYGNLVVSAGQLTKTELLNHADDIIEVLDFSSLLVNPVSLTWSSEIKLGQRYKNGKVVEILKGGIISGNVRESISGFKFSSELAKRNTTGGYFEAASGYYGPEHMLIWNGIKIAGQAEATTNV